MSHLMYDGVRKAPHRWGKSVAEAVGKPYSTLMREINPYDKGAKLGVETFMAIIETTGDPTPLKLMAHELGYRLIPDK